MFCEYNKHFVFEPKIYAEEHRLKVDKYGSKTCT